MDLYLELTKFLDDLKKYKTLLLNPESYQLKDVETVKVSPWLKEYLPVKSEDELKDELKEKLREELVRKSGYLKPKIAKLTGKEKLEKWGRVYDIWSTGLASNPSAQVNIDALNFCIDATNEAIGKLEAEGESWGAEKVRTAKARKEPPKVFIAHEGMTRALDKVKSFLDALGIKYLIAEIEPSDGRVVEEQVEWAKEQADFAIVLATKGKVVDKETGKSYMGMNVADELGRAREVFKNRIILLLQKEVEPHTNISGIVYEPFTTQYMENVFKKIVKEIRNWGLI